MTRTAKRIVAAVLCCVLVLGILAAVGFVSAHRARKELHRRQSIVDRSFTQAFTSAVDHMFYKEDLPAEKLEQIRRENCEYAYFAYQMLYLSSYSQSDALQALTAALQQLAHNGISLRSALSTEDFEVLGQIFRRLPYSEAQAEAALSLLKEHFPDL